MRDKSFDIHWQYFIAVKEIAKAARSSDEDL